MKTRHTVLSLSVLMLSACGGSEVIEDTAAKTDSMVSSAADLLKKYPEPLGEEDVGTTLQLTVPYPDSYAFIHDSSFFNMIDGRFIVFDTAAENKAYKANVHGGNVGSLVVSPEREEFYISTSYFSRGINGERTDIIAIHNMEDMAKKGEIIIPTKRASTMPFKQKFSLAGNGDTAFVFNFTPAASVTVVDLKDRKVLNEVGIPGCTLHYPMGQNSFASICGDGSVLGVNLDEAGNVLNEHRSQPFIDFTDDAAFLKVAQLGDKLYIPTFTGNMHVVDLSAGEPELLNTFSLVSDAERAKNWRPGGWQIVTDDGEDLIYVLMHEDGAEGTHKNGGMDVWVYSASEQKRVKTFKLENHGLSLAKVGDQLIVTNGDLALDVYEASSGAFKRQFAGAAQTPFTVYDSQGR